MVHAFANLITCLKSYEWLLSWKWHVFFMKLWLKKRSERNAWKYLVVYKTYKLKICTVLQANLWPDIKLVKDNIWDVILYESCR